MEHEDSEYSYSWAAAALDWSPPVATRTLYLSLPANNPKTGEPTITGTAQAGQTLTATVGDIAYADGLPDPFFTDTNTTASGSGLTEQTRPPGETSETYTLTADDVGKKVGH